MRGSIEHRVRHLEAASAGGRAMTVREMTDAQLYRVLNVRDPATGALRTDLADDELHAILGRNRRRITADIGVQRAV